MPARRLATAKSASNVVLRAQAIRSDMLSALCTCVVATGAAARNGRYRLPGGGRPPSSVSAFGPADRRRLSGKRSIISPDSQPASAIPVMCRQCAHDPSGTIDLLCRPPNARHCMNVHAKNL